MTDVVDLVADAAETAKTETTAYLQGLLVECEWKMICIEGMLGGLTRLDWLVWAKSLAVLGDRWL